jgi:hypothetical protein
LGSVNSGLMRIGLWLDDTIGRAMSDGSPTLERMHRVLPAIETYLRVMRQVDRFAQLELRAAAAGEPRGDERGAEPVGQRRRTATGDFPKRRFADLTAARRGSRAVCAMSTTSHRDLRMKRGGAP